MVLPFIDRLPATEAAGFTRALVGVASRLNVRPEWLMVVMERESQLKPTARNSQSGASGLIQFMPDTARDLGTTVEAIRRMSATEQLVYVERYYVARIRERGQPRSAYDMYFLCLRPASMGQPDSAIVFAAKTAAYRQNSPLDWDKKGYVIVADVKRFVDRSGWQDAAAAAGLSLGALLFGAGLSWLAYKYVLPSKPTK